MDRKLSAKDLERFKGWVTANAKKIAEELTPIYKATDGEFRWLDRNKADEEITEQIKEKILYLSKELDEGSTYITTGGIKVGFDMGGEDGSWEGYVRFEYYHSEYFLPEE